MARSLSGSIGGLFGLGGGSSGSKEDLQALPKGAAVGAGAGSSSKGAAAGGPPPTSSSSKKSSSSTPGPNFSEKDILHMQVRRILSHSYSFCSSFLLPLRPRWLHLNPFLAKCSLYYCLLFTCTDNIHVVYAYVCMCVYGRPHCAPSKFDWRCCWQMQASIVLLSPTHTKLAA